jgi:hypothetical protein
MALYLKQSTSVDVGIGPFVDSVDGFTAKTALTLTQPDIRLKKNNGNWAQKNAAQTLTHEENGWYELTLNTTDTNTLGILLVSVQETGALPVWHEFQVIPANIYDSLITGSDYIKVDLVRINDVFAPAYALERIYAFTSTATSGSTTTIIDPNRTESVTDFWVDSWIYFANGSNTGQCRLITAFDPAIDTITFEPAVSQAVVNGVNYVILPAGGVDIRQWLGGVPNELINGRVDVNTQLMASGVITSETIAVDAIGASELAADAANEIADAILTRDMNAVSGEAARSLLNAIRKLMNKWSISGTVLTVTKEDDSTTAYTQNITSTPNADAITGLDTV